MQGMQGSMHARSLPIMHMLNGQHVCCRFDIRMKVELRLVTGVCAECSRARAEPGGGSISRAK